MKTCRELEGKDPAFFDLAQRSPNMIMILNSDYSLNYCNPRCLEHIASIAVSDREHPLESVFGLTREQADIVINSLKENNEWRGELKTTILGNVEWADIEAFSLNDGRICLTRIDNTELRLREESIKHRLNYDRITALPNINALYERLNTPFSLSRLKFGLVNVTLNNISYLEGVFGTRFTNQLLKVIANSLLALSPSKDSLFYAALGEFVFLLERDSTEDIDKFASIALSTTMCSYRINRVNIHVGANAGVSVFPDNTGDISYLLSQSRAALKSIKSSWGGEVVNFTQPIMEGITRKLTINQLLHSAISNNEFSLVFQPKYDTLTSRIVGAEVLIRWSSPQLGSVSPIEFIAVAEEFGHVSAITSWVFRETCRYARVWRDEGLTNIAFAVNVPALQLYDLSFVSELKSSADEEGFPLEKIDVELTETMLVENAALASMALEKMQHHNMRIAIDDFGTGYSSLSYLTQLPIDYLKIDRSFILNTPHDEKSKEIVSTIILMGKSLGLKLIAEGVETEEQYNFLKGLGCDQIQGYFFSKPLPPKEFEELLLREKEAVSRLDASY
ncbi:MAG: EAL domain-containing protein [Deferribacteraceae bacterium]|nr:EAL domain-containing protein [Deferribacteraceae bacterium]